MNVILCVKNKAITPFLDSSDFLPVKNRVTIKYEV
jgi:hypothetical protein